MFILKPVGILKIAGKSSVQSVAGSILRTFEDGKDVELHAIGASSTNQAVKAIAAARGVFATKGYDALVRIGFSEIVIEGEERTMMVFKLVIN